MDSSTASVEVKGSERAQRGKTRKVEILWSNAGRLEFKKKYFNSTFIDDMQKNMSVKQVRKV